MTISITPVILCGGSGTRLWPYSLAARPKPFLPLIGETTLFEETVGRAAPEHGFAAPVVVTGARHLDHVEAQLGTLAEATIVVEPAARNTAAAIALAALRLDPDEVMLVCPSDHHIADGAAFRSAARNAAALATEGFLVSLGIEAKSPETGFGYLERGEPLPHSGFRVARFVEKPDRATAEVFLAAGTYAWNGGIFAFRAGTFLDELAMHRPAILDAVRAADAVGTRTGRQFHPGVREFAGFTPESVDYAVMENTARAAMVPADMGWSDIGSWTAVADAHSLEADAEGNIARGSADFDQCRGVFALSDGPRISAVGLENLCIIVSGNEVLVTTRDGAQRVGKLPGAANQ